MKKLICMMISLVLCSFAFAEEYTTKKILTKNTNTNENHLFSSNLSSGLLFDLHRNKSSCKSQYFSKSNTNTFIKKKKDLFMYFKASPFLLYGGSIGIGKYYLSEIRNSMTENIWFFHYHQGCFISMIYTCGVYFQKSIFISKSRKGLFGLLIYGIDYAIVEPSPFEKKTKYKKSICPNLAAGGGYSLIISDDLYLRISLDFGIKCLFTNFNISITF
ncbi:MAG: hypothetical protein U9R23_05540 [Candidatus Cloacimonadota bacterium]|nr:hypothetical protein [Candidatus Cloacimonadota bacterium]